MIRLCMVWISCATLLTIACAIEASPTLQPMQTLVETAQPADTAAEESIVTQTSGLPTEQARPFKQYSQSPEMMIDTEATYTAIINTNKGVITLELFPWEAPVTVNNFVFLAGEGYYDGVIFHRVIRDFMIQTGDPTGTGAGGPGYTFEDEPVTRAYTRGIVAMANGGPNTNGSQFFIVHAADAGLPPAYTIFGHLTEGFDTLNKLAETPVRLSARGELSVPTETLRVESIEVTRSGAP